MKSSEKASKDAIASSIFRSIVSELFNAQIMGNLYRPHYVERLIVAGLGSDFTLMSADRSGWDIEHSTGNVVLISGMSVIKAGEQLS